MKRAVQSLGRGAPTPASEGASPSYGRGGQWLVGVDAGGTFTDAVATRTDGAVRVAKVRSTPADPAAALLAAIRELAAQGVPPARIRLLVHGTTIATNALLQGTLGRVVLVATAGFRDVLTIGTGQRADPYDFWAQPPRQPVAAADCIEVNERMAPNGTAVTPLTAEEVARVVVAVVARRPEAVAVGCLFSYVDDRHERQIADALAAAMPDVPIVRSAGVAPEFREYPRFHTAVVAAGLRPMISGYLTQAAAETRKEGMAGRFLVMLSNGGTASVQRAAEGPHDLVLSGPAGGVAGAIATGARLGVRELISLDMGGTSTDVCYVPDGVAPTAAGRSFNGRPLLSPAIDLISAGAGGGSLARVEAGGSLLVGPASAGAEPGPASYGLGGTEPTVTDAHLQVGDLSPAAPLAGYVRLDPVAGERALRSVGRALGLDVDDAAAAILSVARAHLARAVRRVSIERGRDPRGLTLVAFGGAGPLHAASLLRELRLGEVVVPPQPGLGSAAGLLDADLRIDAAQTVLADLARIDPNELLAWFRRANVELARRLAEDGVPARRRRVVAVAECRYVGQGYELGVPLRRIGLRDVRRIRRDFDAVHARTYGHAAPEEAVEVVTLRLAALGELPKTEPSPLPRGARGGMPLPEARAGRRGVRLPGAAGPTSVPLWSRDALRAGDRLTGPCIVEQLDATTLVLPGMVARVGRFGDLRIRDTT